VNRYLRLAGATIATSALVLALANPAAAIPVTAPVASGEVLTSYGTDCGVLSITPTSPTLGETMTVSLTRAKANTAVSVAIVAGIYKNGRWFPLTPEQDATDGKVALDSSNNSLSTLSLTTDATGTAIQTGNIGQLLAASSSTPVQLIDLELTVIPTLWVVQCDAGVSFAQVRGARASLTGNLALDPNALGSIVGTGLPANTRLSGTLVNMADYPDPGIAAWHAITDQSLMLGHVQTGADQNGTLASTALFSNLAPGRYALGILSIDLINSLTSVLKAEYVITVAPDLSASMALWTESAGTDAGSTSLSLSGGLGSRIADSAARFSSTSLKPDTDWTLTVHSTPQVIAHGIVGLSGILSGSAALPVGLEPGWHTLTLSATDSTGAAGDASYWFKVGAAGELLQVSDTQPAADTAALAAVPATLAATGFAGDGVLPLGSVILLLGVAFIGLARRRTPLN
jgi:hypothetical protein